MDLKMSACPYGGARFSGQDLDLGAINGEGLNDCGIEHAALLVRFAEAVSERLRKDLGIDEY
jgi:hypothetical protein